MLEAESVEEINLAHSGTPWPVSIMSLCEPVPMT